MKKQLTGYLIDVNKRTHGTIEFTDDLDEIYRLLGVDCIDIVTRPIGGKNFTISLDDNGRLKEKQIYSAWSVSNGETLVGNLLITNVDREGSFASLSENDIKRIQLSISTRNHGSRGHVTLLMD